MRFAERQRSSSLLLQRRNLYILPSGFGLLWLAISGVLLVVGVNSRSNGPVLLSQLMVALMLLSLFLTHHNLQGLELRTRPPQPSTADCRALVPLLAISQRDRAALSFRWLNEKPWAAERLQLQAGRTPLELSWQPPGRGLHHPGPLLIQTRAPLGLFRCWSRWDPAMELAIAPARRPGPVGELPLGQQPQPSSCERSRASGSDCFQELSPLRPQEGLQRVAWKALARGQGLHGKRFGAEQGRECWLAPAAGVPLEQALEHLCARLERSLHSGERIGLALPGGVCINPDQGAAHLRRCLVALACVPPLPR